VIIQSKNSKGYYENQFVNKASETNLDGENTKFQLIDARKILEEPNNIHEISLSLSELFQNFDKDESVKIVQTLHTIDSPSSRCF
jgi:hypothetical protein